MEKIVKENIVQEKSLNIIDNPEIITKLKNKVSASPEKFKKMNNKWSKYENEQKLILSRLNEEINKKQVSILKHLISQYIVKYLLITCVYWIYLTNIMYIAVKWTPIFQRVIE